MLLIKRKIFKIKAKNRANVAFSPNPNQQKIVEIIEKNFQSGKKTRLIIIKGRQVGGTALLQRIALSFAMTQPNFAAYTVAHDAESVKQIFQNHVKYSFDTLPEVFRRMYKVDRNNVNQIRFENVECFNSSLTVGQSARSNTIDFLHISEAAKIAKDQTKWRELITGSFEAANSGHIIVESTACGFDAFYDFVQLQQADTNSEWQIVFLPWFDAQEYRNTPPPNGDKWRHEYANLAKKYKLESDPQKKYKLDDSQLYFYLAQAKNLKEEVKAEYPLCLEEAFVSSSDSFFDVESVIAAKQTVKDFKLVTGVKVFVEPEKGRKYTIGVDPATGEGGDNTALSVHDVVSREQVASFSGKIAPEETAVIAVNLARYYSQALICCETNGAGIATVNELRKLCDEDLLYRRIVVDVTSQTSTKIPKFGFATTIKTRPIMLSELRQLFESREQKINDLETLSQMITFVRKKNGRVEHEDGYHDDCIFAVMLANEAIKYVLNA